MTRPFMRRTRQRVRRAQVALLTRMLERSTGRSPVIVPEYSLRPRARWGWSGPTPERLTKLLVDAEPECVETVDAVVEMEEWCTTVARDRDPGPAPDPCWDNSYWGGLDALVHVAELRRRDPALYVEVGSGFSTRFARRAIEDFGLRTRIVSIDPEPRAEIDRLCDEVVRRPAEDVPSSLWDRLEPGDLLLVDGTHTALMSSDATVLFCEVLPRLEPGVLVAIDDVFLPWDYPPGWEPRWYGEQYLVAAFLLGGHRHWRLRFPAWHLTKASALRSRFDPLWPAIETRFGRVANSFWMERASDGSTAT